MSSDGATDKPRPARPGRGDDRGLASIALGVLLILAVVATVVMVFSDNPVWMRIGTLAALWAAFIGAFLVARYRRQAAAEAARVRDLHTVYELQLEREISARREHELVVEKDLRDSIRVETSESVLALRQEIAALREQLGAMGVSLPEDRFAVAGHSAAAQLGAGTLPSVPSERVEPRRRAPEPAPSASESAPSAAPSTVGTPVSGVGPDATPSTERTEKFTPVTGRRARTEPPVTGQRGPAVRPVGEPSRAARRAAEPVAPDAAPAPQAPAAATTPTAPAAAAAPVASSAPAEEPAAQPAQPAQSTPTPTPTEPATPPSRHGTGTGTSVAELMARLGEGDSAGGGRRRRRAED